MTKIITTNINLEDEIRTIKALEAKLEELKELKEVRNNFNTSAFKKKYLELYNAFIKQTNYRKFTIS